MGTEAPRWWENLLDEMQIAATAAASAAASGVTGDHGWLPANTDSIDAIINDLDNLPDKLPKAVFKKLLALQVPVSWSLSICLRALAVIAMTHMFWLLFGVYALLA
jgi:hypothetical protein